ncbi:MAG: helix-turn-helix domain-containing protein [Clostridia bacterium]|nr:helix-turn-helix domain-containing protein [Clostridia bacterium]
MRFTKMLKKNIYFYLFLLFLAMITLTIVIGYIMPRNKLKDEYTDINLTLLNQVNDNIDQVLKVIDNEIINFMQCEEINDLMNGEYNGTLERINTLDDLQDRMRNIKYVNDNIESIYAYSIKTQKILTESSYKPREKFYDTVWIDEFLKNPTIYQVMYTRKVKVESTGNDKNIISIIRPYPITAYRDKVQGAVVVNIDEKLLNEVISQNHEERAFNIFIANEDGIIVSHTDKNEINADYANKDYMKCVLNSDETGYQNLGGNFVFYATSKQTKWKYISVIPDAEMGKLYGAARIIILWGLLLLLIGVVALVIIVLKMVLMPMDKFVTSVANKMSTVHTIKDKAHGEAASIQELEGMFGDFILDYEKVKDEMKNYIPIMKSRVIMDVLMHNITNYTEVESKLEYLDITLYQNSFCVMVAEMTKHAAAEDILSLCDAVEEIVNQDNKGVAVSLYEERIGVILSFEEYEEDKNMLVAIAIADMIKNLINIKQNANVTIGIGNIKSAFPDISDSYYEALEAMKYSVLMGKNSIISMEDIASPDDTELYDIMNFAPRIVEFVKKGDTEGCTKEAGRMFDKIVGSKLSPELIYQVCIHLMILSIRELKDMGIETNMVVEDVSIYEVLNRCKDLDGMKNFICTVLRDFTNLVVQFRQNKPSGDASAELISSVMQYIRKNYKEPEMSLNLLADTFHISAPYLSKIFKETTEMNFIDYLIRTRLEAAKKSLINTNMKINEIAEQVGYTSLPSFIKIFKKYTGKTPGEYRREAVNYDQAWEKTTPIQ